ncbi:MAG: twin-arginine translocation signal domain-containing protein [bacterium]|nr:twin-arginine translocation signal domain-containing protein [bacterium]
MLNSQISRRRFLQSTGLLAGGLAASPAWSLAPFDRTEKGYRRLVVIELHGGNDGLNFMAPTGDDIYHRVRPYLSIGAKGGHKLDDHYRWHPSLANLARRFAEGGCCAIQGVGTRPRNLSHFRSRDVWYMGGHTIPDKELSWLGRLADQQWGLERSPVSLLTVGPPTA